MPCVLSNRTLGIDNQCEERAPTAWRITRSYKVRHHQEKSKHFCPPYLGTEVAKKTAQ